MLIVEYLPKHNLYLAVPLVLINGKLRPDPDTEYVFADEAEQLSFVDAYFRNPCAAVFAYNVLMNARWVEENYGGNYV